MSRDEDDVPDSPATWENVVAGKSKELLGHLIGAKDLVEDGEDQERLAHEVREEYREEHDA